jgi:parvulin-like peptidyl-prolyl isomerase
MKLKVPVILFLLFPLIFPQSLVAKENNSTFNLNGRPVPQVVAIVNGIALDSAALQRELFAFRFQSEQKGNKINLRDEYSIARKLLQSLVASELIVQKAKSLGITITDKQIDLQLKNIEDQFPSHKLFITALAFQHMNIKTLKDKINRTLLEDELLRREIAPKVLVKDESIRKYYEENKALFTKPLLYRVRHIHTSTINNLEKAQDKPSQEKAERLIKMINTEAENKITSLLKRVQDGEDFAKLAQHFSEDDASKESGGLLGELHPGSTIDEIAEEMVKLKEGEASGVLKSKFGYHIIRLDEIIPSMLIPFSDTKTDIMNLLLKRETENLFTIYVEELGINAKIEVFL